MIRSRGFLLSTCAMLTLVFALACGGGEEAPTDDALTEQGGKKKNKGKKAKGKKSKGKKGKSKGGKGKKGKGKSKGKAGKRPNKSVVCCRDSRNPYVYYYAWTERKDCRQSGVYEVVSDSECHYAASH